MSNVARDSDHRRYRQLKDIWRILGITCHRIEQLRIQYISWKIQVSKTDVRKVIWIVSYLINLNHQTHPQEKNTRLWSFDQWILSDTKGRNNILSEIKEEVNQFHVNSENREEKLSTCLIHKTFTIWSILKWQFSITTMQTLTNITKKN